GAILVRWPSVARSHQAYGKKLVHLSKRAQQRNARVEMCAGAIFDKIMTVLDGMRQRHKTRNPEIAGDVEHPKLPSGLGKLGFEIADIRIVKPAQIQFRPLRSVVPPDGIGIAFYQFQETLNDGFFDGVAGGAAIGIGMDVTRGRSADIKEI